jgi:WD40 repeat protein
MRSPLLAASLLVGAAAVSGQEPSPRSDPAQAGAEAIPADTAILHLQLPAGAKAVVDGDEIGAQRRYVFSGLRPGRLFQPDVEVLFADGTRVGRKLLMQGGRSVRLAMRQPEAVRREMVLQAGHLGFVTSVAFSPDGRHALTGAWDQTAILWDAATGRQLRTYRHANRVSCVAFHPKERQVLTGSYDKTAALWDMDSGALVRKFEGHKRSVTAVAFHPGGRFVLTGSNDRTAILWETASGKAVRTFGTPDTKQDKDNDAITSVGFHPSGTQIVVCLEGSAVLWDVESGREIRSIRLGVEPSACFSPDGKRLLTTWYGGAAALWDAATGERVRLFQGPREFHVDAVAFSPDGRLAATGDRKGTIALWDAATGEAIRRWSGHETWIKALAFSPDGRRLLSGSNDHTGCLWDTQTGRAVAPLKGFSTLKKGASFRVYNEVRQVEAVAFSPEGRRILAGYWNGTAALWDAAADRPPQVLRRHEGAVCAVAFSPDGKRFLTGSLDKTAILWDSATAQPLRVLKGHSDSIHAAVFGRDGRHVLTGATDGTAVLWEAATGRQIRTFRGEEKWINAVALSPDGTRAATSSKNNVVLWDVETGQVVRTLKGHSDDVAVVAFSPDGRQILTAGEDNQVLLWDVRTGRRLRTLDGHWKEVFAAAFSPDGRYILTGSTDRTAILWDAATGRQLEAFGHPKGVFAVAFRPDSQLVLTGSTDGLVRLWDVASGDELCRLVSLGAGTGWLVVTPEGLFDGSEDGRQQVAYRVGSGLDVAPVDRFFKDFFRPGLLAALFRGERPTPEVAFARQRPPKVRIVSPRGGVVEAAEAVLEAEAHDEGSGVQGPWLFHNGSRVLAGEEPRREGNLVKRRFRVALVQGDNRLEVWGAPRDGSRESERASINLRYEKPQEKPQLHLVAVGISEYAAEKLRLKYAAADARAVADLFQRRGKGEKGLYRAVHREVLLDGDATAGGIRQAFARLKDKAKPQDTLLVFLAGHGHTIDDHYFFIPHEFQRSDNPLAEDVRRQGLSGEALADLVASVPALHRVVVLDTCHSGSAIGLPFTLRLAVERLGHYQGVYAIAAATATEEAQEVAELGHGVLTYTLLAGLKAVERGPLRQEWVRPGGGEPVVRVLAWFNFAAERVPWLSKKYFGREQDVVPRAGGISFPVLPLEEP